MREQIGTATVITDKVMGGPFYANDVDYADRIGWHAAQNVIILAAKKFIDTLAKELTLRNRILE